MTFNDRVEKIEMRLNDTEDDIIAYIQEHRDCIMSLSIQKMSKELSDYESKANYQQESNCDRLRFSQQKRSNRVSGGQAVCGRKVDLKGGVFSGCNGSGRTLLNRY